MSKSVNRRKFIATVGAGIAGAQLINLAGCQSTPEKSPLYDGGTVPKVWIDNKFYSLKHRSWRKIHLDFHNSQYIPSIGEKFNANEWGDTLLKANVDSITIFAKDMHGFFYYPSKYGPVHPGLDFDLMGEQIKACRERNIQVYTYYCTTWDHHLAFNHPEWLVIKKDGSNYLPRRDQTPGWTALCLSNKSFLELMADHIREWVPKYDIDGAFFDMTEPISAECYCKECISQIRGSGKDPNDPAVQRQHKNELFLNFHRFLRNTIHESKPDLPIVYNDIGIACVSERADLLDTVEIEALPTSSGWGYYFAPAQIRYQRNFGFPVQGMTGRFLSMWADFGGLKHPDQLKTEVASLVANCAGCNVGDQGAPNGILYPAVYHVIGKAFGHVKNVHPWIEDAAPVTEAALMIPTVPMDSSLMKSDYILGMTKLMIEARLQFDLVEPGQPWERYNLIVLPDMFRPDEKTIDRLHSFIEKGGSVIAIHHSGLFREKDESWLEQYGMSYAGESQFKPAYMVPEIQFTDDIPVYEYALYEGASQWKIQSPARSIAKLGEPLFQRSAEHYTSHMQTPFDHLTEYSVLSENKHVGLIGFPLGTHYFKRGYWIYRNSFEKILRDVLGSRLIETDAPLSTEITVTHQQAGNGRKERYMVHLVNWSTVRRSPAHPEFHEDPVPLTDIRFRLNIPLEKFSAKAVVNDNRIEVTSMKNGVEVTIPRIPIHEIISFDRG